MGWNRGYTVFEATVVGAYNLGRLDKELLAVLMEPYRGTDIDAGGAMDLVSTDGKGVEQIVIETWGLTMPEKPQDEDKTSEAWDDFHDNLYCLMKSVTKQFGWG